MGDLKPIARSREQTGDPVLGRIQQRIDEIITRVKFTLSTLNVLGVGSVDIQLPNRDYTMTLEQAAHSHWRFSGPLTAGRRVIVPAAVARNRSFVRWAENTTGQVLTFVVVGTDSVATVNNTVTRALIIKDTELDTLT